MRLFLALLFVASFVHADEVAVSAAASLQDALRAIAPLYEAKTHGTVVYNFGGSNALALQIRAGAPADVFFSADEATMNSVATTERHDILGNRLLILGDLHAARRVALANPAAVPAGVYAREYLQRAGLWREVEPKMIPTENVRAALAAYQGGNVDAAIVYVTDAPALHGIVVDWDIRYPVAVVRGARHPKAARRFVDFLRSPEAMAVFKRFGFIPLASAGGPRRAPTTPR